jgi:hypothetical protein
MRENTTLACTNIHSHCFVIQIYNSLPPAFPPPQPTNSFAPTLADLFPLLYYVTFFLTHSQAAFQYFISMKGLSKIMSIQQYRQPLPTPLPPCGSLCVSIFISPTEEFSVNCNKCKHMSKSNEGPQWNGMTGNKTNLSGRPWGCTVSGKNCSDVAAIEWLKITAPYHYKFRLISGGIFKG